MALTGHRDEVVVVSSEQESRVSDTKSQSQEAANNDNAYTADNEPSKLSPEGRRSPADDPEAVRVEEPRGKFRILAIMLALSVSQSALNKYDLPWNREKPTFDSSVSSSPPSIRQ